MIKKIFFFIIYLIILFFVFSFYKNDLSFILKKKRHLNILLWAGDIDFRVIKEFEEKTDIKLNVSYFSTNEELISKMNFSNEKGIDLIMPSEYILYYLYKRNMLKPFEKNKIENFDKIYKNFLKDGVIRNKFYAIPFEINFYGLVGKKEFFKKFKNKDDLYHSFFKGEFEGKNIKICMPNDILVSSNLVKRYYENYFKNKIADSKALFMIILEILKKQKKNVLVYSDNRVSDLLNRSVIDVAFVQSYEYLRAVKDNPDLEFHSISFAPIKSTEYFAISKNAENIEEIYEFMNFIINPKVMAKNYKYSYSPKSMDISKYEKYPDDINNLMEKTLKNDVKPFLIEEIFSESQKARLLMLLKSF